MIGKHCFVLILCNILALSVSAQDFGGNPASVNWKQIDTDTVRVIFPDGREKEAQRVANMIHYLRRNNYRSIGTKHRKINTVLQENAVVPNGYVGLAPFRSEYHLQEPQATFDLGLKWIDLLAIHEYRHVMQSVNARKGLTNLAYYLTGEAGWSLMKTWSVPNWFSEGDAVVMETSLSDQGRGRMPAFYDGYKSLRMEGISYSYQKARNGSYKDYVPNHYELGYLLCQYGRDRYGNDFWKGILEDAGKYKGLTYPFSGAIKRRTGMPVNAFYSGAFRYYDSLWLVKEDNEKSELISPDTKKENDFVSYRYPYVTSEGEVLVYKASYKKPGSYYVLGTNGAQHRIRIQGRVIDNYFSYRNNKIVWAEYGQHERWSWVSYSNIVLYDINTKKRTRLTYRSKLFSPDISPDGKRIVASYSDSKENYLCVLDSKSGDMIKKIPNPDNLFFSYPKWDVDNKNIITYARNADGKTALAAVNAENGQITYLTEYNKHQFSPTWPTEAYIYFSASFSGNNEVYAFDRKSNKILRVYGEKSGIYSLSTDDEERKMVFSTFTPKGYKIKEIALDPSEWEQTEIPELTDLPFYGDVSNPEEGGNILEKVENKTFEVKKYPKASHLINIHSWSTYVNDPNYEIAIQSTNILNSLWMAVGARYNRNHGDISYFYNASYAQWYPVLDFEANILQRSRNVLMEDETGQERPVHLVWTETTLTPGVVVPLDLGSGAYSRNMEFGAGYMYKYFSYRDFDVTQSINAVDLGWRFINYRKKARQNIYSHFSQYLGVRYQQTIDNTDANLLFADSEFSFPGILANHNLVFQLSAQLKQADNDPFTDNFSYARGYESIPMYDDMYKIGANYHFPIMYPDFGLAGIVYFSRVRGNIFYDYSFTNLQQEGVTTRSDFNSTGGEVIIDTNLMNALPVSFGFRYSRLLNTDPVYPNMKNNFEIFIPLLSL